MKSTDMLEKAGFQNIPLRELLFLLSFHFKVLYISPPTPAKIQSTLLAKMTQRAGESYETTLENYQEDLNRLNSEENSNWMEVSFDEALQFSDDKWGPIGYISNEMTPPVASAKIKRKFGEMSSSHTRNSQGGDFSPFDQSEGEDTTGYEDDDEDYNEGDDGGDYQPPSTRRRLD